MTGNIRDYEMVLADQERPLPVDAGVHDLIRYATMAASSHNTQPWRFRVGARSIGIEPDFSRRTPVVDPDDHHLYASLGCAAENLSLAARGRGRAGEVTVSGDGTIRVSLEPDRPQPSPRFDAVLMRQCTRAVYDRTAVADDIIGRLAMAVDGTGVEARVVIDDAERNDILDLIVAGNSRQFDDPAFRSELKAWLRFNRAAAARTRDGLFSAASGNPALPNWLGPIMYDLTVTTDRENRKTIEQIRSSSGIVVFVADTDGPAGPVAAGRAYQRFALQATVEGLKHAFVNQAVEVPEVRRDLQSLLSLGDRRPNLVVRFGRGPAMPRSLRRPVDDVIIAES